MLRMLSGSTRPPCGANADDTSSTSSITQARKKTPVNIIPNAARYYCNLQCLVDQTPRRPVICSEITTANRHKKCSTRRESRIGSFQSRTVKLKSYAAVSRASLCSNARLLGLRLVRRCAPEQPQGKTQAQPRAFSSAEMRHNFAVWSLDKEASCGRRLHLYYCLRC